MGRPGQPARREGGTQQHQQAGRWWRAAPLLWRCLPPHLSRFSRCLYFETLPVVCLQEESVGCMTFNTCHLSGQDTVCAFANMIVRLCLHTYEVNRAKQTCHLLVVGINDVGMACMHAQVA